MALEPSARPSAADVLEHRWLQAAKEPLPITSSTSVSLATLPSQHPPPLLSPTRSGSEPAAELHEQPKRRGVSESTAHFRAMLKSVQEEHAAVAAATAAAAATIADEPAAPRQPGARLTKAELAAIRAEGGA